MSGVAVVPFWTGKWGSIDRKYFNTEEARGPQRATEKQNMSLRAMGVGIGVVRRLRAGAEFCLVFGRGAGRLAVLRFSVALCGPRAVSVLKFFWCQRRSPRQLRSDCFAWPLVTAGKTERGRNDR